MRHPANREELRRRDQLSKYMNTTRNVTSLYLGRYSATDDEIRIALLKCLTSFAKLKSIELNSNRMNDIPRTLMEQCTNLKSIDLRCNKLSCIPVNFKNFVKLEELLLYDNKLVHIAAEALGALTQLRVLNLSYNTSLRLLPPVFISWCI